GPASCQSGHQANGQHRCHQPTEHPHHAISLSNILVENHSRFAFRAVLRLGHRCFHCLKHRIGKRLCSACTAHVPGQDFPLTVNLLDSCLHPFRSRALIDVVQHQHC